MLITAFFFEIWYWVMPLRDYLDGNSSVSNLVVMGIGYIILAGIMSVKWSLLYRITGSLWTGLADHLFNNIIVTNLLHVVSENESDNMQIVRILTGQLISFFAVLIYYRNTGTFVTSSDDNSDGEYTFDSSSTIHAIFCSIDV